MKNRIIATCVMVWAIGLNGAGGQDTRPAHAQAATQPENSITVAILDYEAAAPGNKDMGSQMAEILTARLGVEPSLMLVERAQMNKILDEQKLKLVGLVGNDKAAQVGKLLGAKLLVMGKARNRSGRETGTEQVEESLHALDEVSARASR